ncbi:MAG: ATP-binding protein [Gaiellales bacterium]
MLSDVNKQRHEHAITYLTLVLPLLVVVGWVIVVLNDLANPLESITRNHYWAMGALTALASTSFLLSRTFDSVQVVVYTLIVQFSVLAYSIATSEVPERDAMFVIWPIIVIAYFGRPRLAAYGGVTAAVAMTLMSIFGSNWDRSEAVPTAAYVILLAGFLMAFVMREGRRVELSLISAVTRDRAALALARSIRLTNDPQSAIMEIARAIGTAAEVDHAMVVTFEHEENYVSDIATWSSESFLASHTQAPALDVATLDATLRHLLITCHGAVGQIGDMAVIPAPGEACGLHADAAEDRSVSESMRALLARLSSQSGLLIPLPLGGRAVGAVLLAANRPIDWRAETLPMLERITPQLGAGLAQVVLLRDQRDALHAFEQIDRMRNRLIANVSHELRTPLTSTIGFIETLLRTDVSLSEEQRTQLMMHARDGGMRLLALVEDLLQLGSIRPDSLDLDPEPVPVEELIHATLLGIELPHDRPLTIDVHDDLYVKVDRNRMLQVLTNLLTNAIRHGTGRIEISGFADGKCALIDVVDEGGGIAPEHLGELFLPFATFSTRSDSTGLGLAISRTIVEAHDGTIEYEQLAPHRTRFRLQLPLVL